ncbi:MAG: hypothetical protein QXM96_04025, partial [Candidatus Woesearchaeota archaeon]
MPKEKYLEGTFTYDVRSTLKQAKGGTKTYYTTDICHFKTAQIDETTEFIGIAPTKNCIETSNLNGEDASRSIGGFNLG